MRILCIQDKYSLFKYPVAFELFRYGEKFKTQFTRTT